MKSELAPVGDPLIFEDRVQKVFDQNMMTIATRTDRMFAWLMAAQWAFGILLAFFVSPYTWAGRVSSTNPHVYAAILLGGAVSSLPIVLVWLRPGAPITRYTIAVAQMLWSALLIHLTGGRLETHFHVFGSLAFLAFYRDRTVLIPATLVVAGDHFLRGILWPESVYGILNPVWWRFIEHALWVVFENFFLLISIRDSRRASMAMARRQVELETVNASVEFQVQERTSELAASREQYRSLLETTLAIPWEFDLASSRFSYVGPQATRILDYAMSEWTTEGFLATHVHPDDHAAVLKLTHLAREEKADVEFRLKDPAGRWVWLRNIIGHSEDKTSGQVLRGIMLDVTERKKLETELVQAQKLESVGRLAAGIAHEINTPVQFVSDSIDFIRDGTQDLTALVSRHKAIHEASSHAMSAELAASLRQAEEGVDFLYLLDRIPKALNRAHDGLQRVAVIVRSLKEFAHPDQKEKTAIDINQSIASTLTIARNEYRYVADVETDFAQLPPVICHVGDVNQVILNIVVNAAHAISDLMKITNQKGRIHVRTSRDDDDVLIAIADTGGGIPEEIRDKVFDLFFTTKPFGRGTGQGLAIARSAIVDKHGGSIDFESETGRGTTFFIRLPIDGRPRNSSEAA